MYYAHPYTTPRERVISGAFASTMHVMFIALLVFGVNWQKKAEPQVNIVDLWSPVAEAPATMHSGWSRQTALITWMDVRESVGSSRDHAPVFNSRSRS